MIWEDFGIGVSIEDEADFDSEVVVKVDEYEGETEEAVSVVDEEVSSAGTKVAEVVTLPVL